MLFCQWIGRVAESAIVNRMPQFRRVPFSRISQVWPESPPPAIVAYTVVLRNVTYYILYCQEEISA
jgi:hypothetical protein